MSYLNRLRSALLADDADERRQAVDDLAVSNRPEAVLELLVALLDPSPRIREAAVDALGGMVPTRVCRQIIPLLSSDDAALRGYVIEVLEMYGTAAEADIIDATGSKDQDIRKFALDLLMKNVKRHGSLSPRALQAITRCFSDPNVNVAGAAIEALGYTNNKDYLPLITRILKSKSAWMQCAAISSLVRLTGSDAPAYFAAIERSDLSDEAQAFLDVLLPSEAAC